MIDIDLLLAWGAAYKKVLSGETIFQEGQPCYFYYQLVSGKVRWYNNDDDGKECLHSIAGPGESFGELPLFDDRPYSASAIADENSIVIRLHKPTFLKLVKENSDLLFDFTKLLSGRLRFKYAIIKAYGSHCPENIIATLLNNLKAEKKNFCYDCNQLDLTRQQIADMTGLRVETVIRTMRNMHDKGDLVISRGKVYYHDMIEVIKA
ncbi:MAG: Crp/Fnr family transcriptional regulator [Ferruginibacter sp.]